jgi:hypothetical protein
LEKHLAQVAFLNIPPLPSYPRQKLRKDQRM